MSGQVSEISIRNTVTIPSGLPANKTTFADLLPDIDTSTTSPFIQIPDKEAWIILDIYIAVAGDIPNADGDCYLTLEKNRKEKKVSVGPLSTMLITNQQRGKLMQGYGFEAGSILRIIATNIAVPAANRTNVFYLKIAKMY